MKPECLQEIATAIGRAPTKTEAEQVEAGLLGQMRELARTKPQEWAGMSGEQRLRAAAAAASKAAIEAADKAAQRKAQNLVAQARETARIDARAAQLKARGSKQAHHDAVFERLNQVDNYVAGLRNEYLAQLSDAILAVEPRFFGLLEDPAKVADFAAAVLDGKASTPEMQRAGKAYTEAMEALRLRANAAGADIGKLDYAYLPQPHDTGSVARAGADKWVADVLPMLARDRYVSADGKLMNDAEIADLLRGAWTTIATEGRNKLVPGAARGGSRASRFDEAHRAIHFKDSAAYLTYMRNYGRGSMMEAITGHVGMMTKTIGIMEEFGPNSANTYRLLKDTAEVRDPKPGARNFGATLDMYWDTLNGTTGQPVSARLAQVGQTIRSFTVATKLQGTLLSAVTDVPLQLIVAKSSGVPMGDAMKSLFSGFGGSKQQMARELALGMDEIAGEMALWHDGNLGATWASKLASTTMRLSLLEGWTNGLRRGFSLTYSGTLARMVGKDWGKLNEGDRRIMEESGVTEADWRIWQLAEPEEFKGAKLLTKSAIRDIPTDKLDALLGGDLARVRAEADAQIEKLDARNRQENEWVAKREAEYRKTQDDVLAAIEDYEKSQVAGANAIIDDLQAQAELLQAQIDLTRAQRGLDLAEAGTAGTGYTAGRARGETIGRLERRISELKAKARAAESAPKGAVGKKAEALGRRLAAHRRELDAFIENATKRVEARDAVMRKIARGVNPALDRVRDAAIDRATARLLGHIDAQSKTAVLAPDLRIRATMQQSTRAGTIGGEVLRMATLFKSFPLAVVDRHLRRVRNIPTTQGKVAYSAALLTSLTLFGAIALQLKDLVNGKDPRDMTTGKFWGAAFLQGGGIGIFGDLLYTGMGGNARGGQANWTGLAGPVFGTGMDAADVTLSNAFKAAQGEETQFAADSLRFAKGNTPFINLWYLRGAIDHMVLHDLQEQASPGYLRRMQKRARKDWQQEYWWEPGEIAPDRAPDLKAAVGE